jgi:hypothetical protein
MKKLIALMALACMFAVGCKTENKGGTSDNYSTSGSMQSQPSSSSSTISTNSSSTTQP